MSIEFTSRPGVSIIVPTFNRHDGLRCCLTSLFALPDAAMERAELIVADNSPDANARPVYDALTVDAPLKTRYISETSPGVANVRNTALKHADEQLVIWLDDDQSVGPGWLDAFVRCFNTHAATVTFGPIRTVLPAEGDQRYPRYYSRYFERAQRPEAGFIDDYYGCGNSMFDMAQIYGHIKEGAEVFEKEANEFGGEDDRLFQLVEGQGGRFAWCREAWANEHPPAHRVDLSYTLKRSFVYGQGPSAEALRGSPPNVPALLYWMGVGLGQTVVYGAMAAATRLAGREDWVIWADKTLRGAGKVLWFPPFQFRFYGAAYNQRKKKPTETRERPRDASEHGVDTPDESERVTP